MSDQRKKTGSSSDTEYQRLIGDTISELDSKLAEQEGGISGETVEGRNKLVIHWVTVMCFLFALGGTLIFLYQHAGVGGDHLTFQDANELIRADLQQTPQTDRAKLVANAVIDFTIGVRLGKIQDASKVGELYSELQMKLQQTGEDEELLTLIRPSPF